MLNIFLMPEFACPSSGLRLSRGMCRFPVFSRIDGYLFTAAFKI